MNKKPDYTDLDWSYLIKDRTAKWQTMLDETKQEHWQIVPLRCTDDFTSQLILLPVHKDKKRGALIVCAGGGFMFKSSNEAKPVAEYFHGVGLNTAILDYHVAPSDRLEAGLDGLAAVRYLRLHADTLGILSNKIAIGGFSAGGMLSGMASTMFDYGDPNALDPLLSVSSRPDAALILYGAMSQAGTIPFGVGQYNSYEQTQKCITDVLQNLKTDSPPMFVFQTHKDDPRHALLFCYRLACLGVPYEIHTFEDGPHGGALYDGSCEDSPLYKHTSRWAQLAAEWLEEKGF